MGKDFVFSGKHPVLGLEHVFLESRVTFTFFRSYHDSPIFLSCFVLGLIVCDYCLYHTCFRAKLIFFVQHIKVSTCKLAKSIQNQSVELSKLSKYCPNQSLQSNYLKNRVQTVKSLSELTYYLPKSRMRFWIWPLLFYLLA